MPRSRDARLDVLCVGLATMDTIVSVEVTPSPDERVEANAIVHAGGGPAATAAVVLARLGARAGFAGVIGDDEVGQQVLEGLESEGVDTTGVLRAPGYETPQSCVIAARSDGTRSICTTGFKSRIPPSAAGELAARLGERTLQARWVHVDHLGYELWQAQPLKAAPPGLSIDGGNRIEGLVLSHVALYAPTCSQLVKRYGADLDDSLRLAHRDGAVLVVATAGEKGCVVSAGGRIEWVEAAPAKMVSALGAGDAFHGALLFALLRGDELLQAARFATAIAAEACGALDGRSGVARRGAGGAAGVLEGAGDASQHGIAGAIEQGGDE